MLYGIIPDLLGVLTYILTVYYAVLWFLPYLTDRFLAIRIKGFGSTLVFPIATVSVEFLNNLIYGSWASIAYTQFDNLPLIQISSIFGIWGITFLVQWFASAINWILDNKMEWNIIRKGVVIYSGLLLLVLVYGGIRLGLFPPDSRKVKVVSFTPYREIDEFGTELENRGYSSSVEMAGKDRNSLAVLLDTLHRKVFQHNKEILGNKTSITLWPEGSISVLEEYEDKFLKRGSELAKDKHVYLVMGYFVIPKTDPTRNGENKAVLINPGGEIEWQYLKSHPVPGSTDKPGDGILPVYNTPVGTLSTTICYDMDFTQLINPAGRKGVDIMLVPAWDWKAIDPLHTQMAVFRAVENGFSMVRQTGKGLSVAVDYQGRILASMDHFTSNDLTMTSQVPVKGTFTLYSFWGDIFAWLCLISLLGIIIFVRYLG